MKLELLQVERIRLEEIIKLYDKDVDFKNTCFDMIIMYRKKGFEVNEYFKIYEHITKKYIKEGKIK